jgi:hypothetical protein
VDIEEGAVHFAGLVLEDAQLHNFVGEDFNLGSAITLAHTQENEQAALNLAYNLSLNRHTGAADSL